MAKAAIVHFKSKSYTNGHPVLLRVTHRGKLKYYTLEQEFVCEETDWDNEAREFKKSFGKNYKRANLILARRRSEAQKTILDLEDQGKTFSFDLFKRMMFKEESDLYLLAYMERIALAQIEIDKIKNADVYRHTKSVLTHFLKGKDVLMRDFDFKKLMSFENFLRKRGNKDSSIHNRMRTLRATFNKARKEEGLENYPFTNYDFGKLKTETRRRAISPEDLRRILNHVPEDARAQDTILLYRFMFYARGINYGDLARLEYGDVINGILHYRRSKSKKEFSVEIHHEMQLILDHFEAKSTSSKYLFPILHEDIHKSEQHKVDRIKKTLRQHNHRIQSIAEAEGVVNSSEITTNVMRHTWATAARDMGISESTISEAMGHKDFKTTRIYLASLDQGTINEANRKVSEILKS